MTTSGLVGVLRFYDVLLSDGVVVLYVDCSRIST